MEIPGHDAVDGGELLQIRQEQPQPYHLPQMAACSLHHGLQVAKRLMNLRLEAALDQLAGLGIERDLTGQIHRVAGTNRLRIGAQRGRSIGGGNGKGHDDLLVVMMSRHSRVSAAQVLASIACRAWTSANLQGRAQPRHAAPASDSPSAIHYH